MLENKQQNPKIMEEFFEGEIYFARGLIKRIAPGNFSYSIQSETVRPWAVMEKLKEMGEFT